MTKTLDDLAETMRDIDFTMLSTTAEDGGVAARPMSNNRDVAYDGSSWFFTLDTTQTVADIARDPHVGLTLHGNSGLLGKPPTFIAAAGRAEVIRDRAAFDAHWNPDLDRWFADGADTPGLVLLHVRAERLHYWDGGDEGEVTVPPAA